MMKRVMFFRLSSGPPSEIWPQMIASHLLNRNHTSSQVESQSLVATAAAMVRPAVRGALLTHRTGMPTGTKTPDLQTFSP